METKNSVAGPFARALTETPLIETRALDAAMATISQAGNWMAEPELFKCYRAEFDPKYTVEKGIATVPVSGILINRPSLVELFYYGAEDTEKLTGLVYQAAKDPEVRGIVLDIDSPGGYVVGISELGDAVRQASKKKPVVAHSSGLMASAAYWVGSQANEIVVTRSSIIGSIGVYAAYYDYSARLAALGVKVEVFANKEGTYKGAGLQGTSLSNEQRELIQQQVQDDFNEFRRVVRSTRPNVSDDAMQGQTFPGRKAVASGLADHTGTRAFANLRAKKLLWI